jgi:hypothetical protein
LYPFSPEPPVSVEALHERLTSLQLVAVAVKPVGTDGAVASGHAGVVALDGELCVLWFPALSTADTV